MRVACGPHPRCDLSAFASGIELLLGGRVASVRLLQISGFQRLRPGCSLRPFCILSCSFQVGFRTDIARVELGALNARQAGLDTVIGGQLMDCAVVLETALQLGIGA